MNRIKHDEYKFAISFRGWRMSTTNLNKRTRVER